MDMSFRKPLLALCRLAKEAARSTKKVLRAAQGAPTQGDCPASSFVGEWAIRIDNLRPESRSRYHDDDSPGT